MCSLCECAYGHQRTRSGTCPHLSFSLRPCVFLFSTVSQASWLTGPHGCSSLCLPPHCGSGAGGTQLHSPLWQMPYPLGHVSPPRDIFLRGFTFTSLWHVGGVLNVIIFSIKKKIKNLMYPQEELLALIVIASIRFLKEISVYCLGEEFRTRPHVIALSPLQSPMRSASLSLEVSV